jgi:hypothetical protein
MQMLVVQGQVWGDRIRVRTVCSAELAGQDQVLQVSPPATLAWPCSWLPVQEGRRKLLELDVLLV